MKGLNNFEEIHFGDLVWVSETLGDKVLLRRTKVERVDVFSENDDKVGQSHGIVFGSLHLVGVEKIS